MSIEERLIEMLLLQDETNSKVFPDWRYRLKSRNFRTAQVVEAGELADHLGYKWWSQKESNLDQARMEMVDIWHFLLSEWMLAGKDATHWAGDIQLHVSSNVAREVNIQEALDFLPNLMDFCSTIGNQSKWFWIIAERLGITFNWLYKHYVGKAALNRFRWANSYGSGYQKIWNGREDNEHLTEILATLDDEHVGIETITALLQERYAERG